MSEITRRNFVKGVSVGAAALATGANARADAHAQKPGAAVAGDRDYDVVVIGGGFAGVTAARETSNAGLRTVILEARNRLGGRTFSSKFAGHKVELGGTWIHWTQPHVWAQVMRYGLEVVETPGSDADEFIYLRDNKPLRGGQDIWDDFFVAIDKLCAPSREILPLPYEPFSTQARWEDYDRVTIPEGIAQAPLTPQQAYLAEAITGSMAHNNAASGSFFDVLRWYALGGFNAPLLFDSLARYKLTVGTIGLIDRMIEEGKPDIELGSVVAAVQQSRDGVTVMTESGEEFRARAVVVTVPMNALKNVAFSPSLSKRKLAASKEEHSGRGTKLYAEVRGDLGDIMLMGPSSSALSIAFTYEHSADSTLLVGFGPGRELLDVNDREAVGQAIRRFLPDAEVTASFGYDWVLDPFSLGTWGFYKPRQASRYWKELQRTEGKLYFASADSADGWRGFIDGAIERGLRVGNEVREQLG